jgi:glycosyltransferase involved in cell wall biosynthesis
MLLSVIVPCFNEEGNIDLFYDETVKALGDLMPETELIFVNDGSRDGTVEKLRALCARAQYRVRVVSFSRNFGKEAALLAGLEHATGDFTSIIDADLQQNPSYIVEMMQILKDHPEYDAVAAYQEERRENFLISFIKKTFYKVMDSLTDVKIMQAASDFRLLRRPVVDAILSMPEKCRFSKGIFAWVGFETYYMPYEVEERASGTSKWNFWKLLTYAFDGIVAFSNKPLIMSSVVGFFIFCLSILYLIVIVVKTILWGDPVAGFPTLACLILMLSGIQLLGIGILGQYMAKNYTETKGRPVYIVKEELDSAGGAQGPGAAMPGQDK